MAATYIPIASTTLTTSAASVTFSAIPQTYTDLLLKITARTDRASFAIDIGTLQMNSVTGSVYSITRINGNGSTATSSRETNDVPTISFYTAGSTATSNTFGNSEIYIPNYTGSTNKVFSGFAVQEDNTTGAFMAGIAGLIRDTGAITQLVLASRNSANFVSGSTFHLYGISNT